MRSVTPITRRMSCSMSSTVYPSARILRIRSIKAAFSAGLNPAAGSSRHSSLGSVASARAISSRRWSPYGRFLDFSVALAPMPTNSSSAMPRSMASRSSCRCRGIRNSAPGTEVRCRASVPTTTFSSAVISENNRMFWNVLAIPRRVIWLRLSLPSTCPSKPTVPDVGR